MILSRCYYKSSISQVPQKSPQSSSWEPLTYCGEDCFTDEKVLIQQITNNLKSTKIC